MHIGEMTPSEIGFAAECTASEGWESETATEIEALFSHDPSGCFVAEANGKKIGICIATNYGVSAFIGELIVIKEMRRLGIGRRLMERAIKYLTNRGVRNILLDGVPAAVPLYERIGFRKICKSLRLGGRIENNSSSGSRQMKQKDLVDILKIDHGAFGADRRFFLSRRLSVYPELCRVLEVAGKIAGYIMGRRGRNIVSIGPWVTLPSVEDPATLLQDIAPETSNMDLRLGVLETNEVAIETARSMGLRVLPDPPWRMALGPSWDLGSSNQCFAIGSPAKG